MNQNIHDFIKHIAKLEREISSSRTIYHKKKGQLKNSIQALSDTYHKDQNIQFKLLNDKIDELMNITGQLTKEEKYVEEKNVGVI